MIVARAKKPTKTEEREAAMHPLVRELTGAIWRIAEPKGWTREKLAEEAGRGVTTWYGWRNASRDPMLLDLQAFAKAVGLNVRLVGQDGAVQQPAGADLTSEMRQLITMMDGMPKHVQQDILDFAERHSKRWSSPENPPDADAAKK